MNFGDAIVVLVVLVLALLLLPLALGFFLGGLFLLFAGALPDKAVGVTWLIIASLLLILLREVWREQ